MKRLIDLFISVFALIVLFPVFVVISIAVWLDSGLPVFFFQDRIGQYGQTFKLVKFRSMRVLAGSEKGAFDAGNNLRVTRIGKVLRRTKLDEIPQFWNVLVGQMSLVGPRPEVKKWTMVYPEKWALVHAVRPGITDYASLEFRHEEDLLQNSKDPESTYRDEILPIKLNLYIHYVNNVSLKTDFWILWKSLLAILRFNT